PVGAVDACRVVDEVGVQPSAIQAVFDAAALGHAEIAAFADNLAAQLVRIYAHRVVALVTHLHMAFAARLYIRSNAAVPQKVDWRLQYAANQFVRLHSCLFGAEQAPCFLAELYLLGLPGPDTTSLRNKLLAVIRPARAGQLEQPSPLAEARLHIRLRIDEDVLVVECSNQLDLRR